MIIQSLNGAWTLSQASQTGLVAAQVPGCVHLDLLAAEMIDEPFFRDNEARQFWIAETDWIYRHTFTPSPELLAQDRILLRCHGLDTLATIQINGVEIARTDNMYRVYTFDVKPHLHAGENTITILFAAPMPYLRQQEAEKGRLFAWSVGEHRLNSGAWLRKEPSNFGWDWGPQLVTSGIWRDIELVGFSTARISDVLIQQDHADQRVDLSIRLAVERTTPDDTGADLRAAVTVSIDGETVAHMGDLALNAGMVTTDLTIEQPRLWWPHGMGDQPLYTVTVQLFDAQQQLLDTVSKRIGLRTLRLDRHADAWGESFQFVANGVPFFAKGANWIPADTFAPRLTVPDYEALIVSATDVHMNMLRVWGGGLYEDDRFYDLCDEYGICIWQDFIFACGTYPAFDADFMANVKAEAEDNVRRLRHHACLALWCGNNELEQGLVGAQWTDQTMSWDDYGTLFDDLLPAVVREHDPQRDYWPGSPHSPHGDRNDWWNPQWGDVHLWEVWHQKKPFAFYRSTPHRFVSEFGLQSFPEPHTTYSFTEPEDRNLTSYVLEYHQRSGIGNSTIMHYLLDSFRLPATFEALLWLSQILQGMALKTGIEHWRRNMPRTMGTLYWQLNDCWPAPSWSTLDHTGRWKASHYMAKRFYAPLLLSAVEDTGAGTVALHVTSDHGEPVAGTVKWALTDLDGAVLAEGTQPIIAAPRQNTPVTTLELAQRIQAHGERNLLLWAELHTTAGRVSGDVVWFAPPKHLELRDPGITTTVTLRSDQIAEITLAAQHPALFVWLDLPGHYVRIDDNFLHLRPGIPQRIIAHLTEALPLETIQNALAARSLIDTY